MTHRNSWNLTGRSLYSDAPPRLGEISANTMPWADTRALCAQADPAIFYPEKGGSTRAAKAVCVACPLLEACAEWAIETGERFGIFGGMSERERRAERKRRGIDTPGATPRPALCGTDSGYYRHLRTLVDAACDACLEAHRAAQRARKRKATLHVEDAA